MSYRQKFRHGSVFMLVLAAAMLFTGGCTPRSYLIVDYQLPPASSQLAGRIVQLKVNDLRQDTRILSPAAAQEFEGFKDRYSLAWVDADNRRHMAGEHDLQTLFEETFRKRLERMGADVVRVGSDTIPLLQIDLHALKLDLKGHDWVVTMDYTATLSQDDRVTAKEDVKGSAQRTKVIGRKGADTALSGLFSDMVNRLNLVNLFEQAGIH